jgi:Queuosine biosynthesis protein QueC
VTVMRYFGNPSSAQIQEGMRAGRVGMTVTPAQGNRIPEGAEFIIDNGCFGGAYPGDDGYIRFLERLQPVQDRCLFAVAPDIAPKGPMRESLARSRPMLQRIRAAGYRAALVLQNGTEDVGLLWGEFDVVFIGGDDAWKLGPAARAIAVEARRRGKLVHMGRVNTFRRLRYAQEFCDSADGTCFTRAPDVNFRLIMRWLASVNGRIPLYGLDWEDTDVVRPAVVLVGAGLSSAVTLASARADGFLPYKVNVTGAPFGDGAAGAARALAVAGGSAHHVTCPVGGFPAEAWAWNSVCLSFALGQAETIGTGDIFIGASAVEGDAPDCRPMYIRAFEQMATLATRPTLEGRLALRIHTPLAGLTREQVTSLGNALGAAA